MNRFYTVLISSLRSVAVILFWLLSSIIVQSQVQPYSVEALKKKSEALMLQMEKAAMDQMAKEVSKLQQKKTSTKAASNNITLASATQSEHDALVAFYNSTGGPSWTNSTNWLSALPINQWYGVQVDGDDHVIALSLVNNNLFGPIPPHIKDLSWLRYLYLQDNRLNGLLPPELGMLSDLRSMFLHYNNFSGTIPSEFGNLQQLQDLWLNTKYGSVISKLTGAIPSSIGNIQTLQRLVVGNNELTGPLPTSIGSLQNLKFLGIENNLIKDSIPDEWMQLSNLEYIQAYSANLTGDIPAGLTNLLKLKNIILMDNHLKGSIPSQLNNLTSLEDFMVLQNRFTFSDILNAKRNFVGNYFWYSPQDSVDTRKNISASIGNSLTLTALVDRNTSPSCRYQWFKYVNGTNDIPVTPTASEDYHTQIIPNISSADQNAKYYYKITHPEATDLTLISRLQKIVLSGSSSCSSTLAEEYNALMSLYQSTNGVEWTNNTGWRNANPNVVQSLTGWFGLVTNAEGHVIQIELNTNNLTGTLPSNIVKLSKLEVLNLAVNKLNGSIPNSIGSLCKLRTMNLLSNQLVGSIPSSIGNLADLVTLDFSSNQLRDSIPSSLGNLLNLQYLHLGGNQLTGQLPSQLGNLGMLQFLYVHSNNITGPIPSTLGGLTSLKQLFLMVNQFSGSIPESLGSLNNLTNLQLNQNQLTGFIPAQLGNLSKLEIMDISSNQLTGSIPSSLGSLLSLQFLHLGGNQLTGSIPAQLGNLSALRILYMHSNSITGTIPTTFNGLINLEQLYLMFNSLTGPLPTTLGSVSKLTHLNLSGNKITDSIPFQFGDLSNLQILDISSNQLSGTIPSSFGNLLNLQQLSLGGNQLTGPLPDQLGNLTALRILYLHSNSITGTIPSTFGGLINLEHLYLMYNQLSGTLPPSLGSMIKLTQLNLTMNQITGPIPFELGNLSALQLLDLSSNQFNGPIPSSIGNLLNLQYLHLGGNQLSGTLSSLLSGATGLSQAYIHSNKITFSGFLDFKQAYTGSTFLYVPQDSIDITKTLSTTPGTPVTLTTSIDRNTNPASKYQWFKFVNGSNDISITPLSTTSHTFILQNPSESDDGSRYYYKIYNDSAANLILTSRLQTLRIRPCTIAMNPRFSTKKYLCALNFVPTGTSNNLCTAINYFWDFGDGATSSIKSPVHAYGAAGTYNVSLRFTFQCGSCQKDTTVTRLVSFNPAEEILTDSLIQVPTTIKKQVISASVATFSDSWPLQHHANLTAKNSFISGSEGIWRNEAAFVYDVPRQVSDSSVAKISSDGTFDMEKFNWEYADLEAVPNWIKANTMTEYSPFSYELENRDVLGIYSAALYDYGGHLPSANGVNMRNAEMAFTSFEFLDGNVTGNWLFGNKPAPAQYVYKVQSGKNYMAIVEVSMDKLDGVTQVDIATQGRSKSFTSKLNKLNKDVKIVCLQEHPLNPKWTIVVFERSMGTLAWSGKLIVKNPITPVVTPDIDNSIAHSGESSLRIVTEKTFRQDILKLEVEKKYWISGWVSVNNASLAIPKLADGLGIEVIFKNKTNQIITTSLFEPSGKIIEGWQQVKGSFQSTTSDAIVEIKFKPGSTGTAWYDDFRLHPEKGNMKTYVYNLKDYRLQAILDEENFASFFYYDKEGNLYLTKKETEEGIKTLTENVSYQIESGN